MSDQEIDRTLSGLERFVAPVSQIVAFVEWMADQPCEGNGSGQVCRVNAPNDPAWCCPPCRAALLRYGRQELGDVMSEKEVDQALEKVAQETRSQCDHGVVFDEVEAIKLIESGGSYDTGDPAADFIMGSPSSDEIRKRWPRLFGRCPKGCGFEGIAYASFAHMIYGDW